MEKGKYIRTPECREKSRQAQLGHRNNIWKGDDVGYKQLHKWIRLNFPPPERCEECSKIEQLDLANITGVYDRDINNYRYLCRSCHWILDEKINNIPIEKRRGYKGLKYEWVT